jgi:hypothetical protein
MTTVLLALALGLAALLAVFVLALLRSHAEIIARLTTLERQGSLGPQQARSEQQFVGQAREPRTAAPGIVGQTLAGDAVKLDLGEGSPTTLLAFLSSGCAACAPLWRDLHEGVATPAGARLLLLAKDLTEESPSHLAELAPGRPELVLSTQAWRDYAVPASPHFVLVDGGSGTIVGRGSARSWEQIAAIVERAIADAELDRRRARSTSERAERAEQALAVAGIGPGHPSLYPSRHAPQEKHHE